MAATLTSQDAADLADALARGRLCMAEVADISQLELNALYEVGARKLQNGATADAVQLMAGLIMLFPYSAKYWRGYGVCLHRQGALQQAAAAYRAAVLLDPGHGMSQCYLGEVLVQLGDSAGVGHVMAAAQSADEPARSRAALLLKALQPETLPVSPAPVPISQEVTDPLFNAADGRTLPLSPGRLNSADAQYKRPRAPEPVTDRIFLGQGPQEITGTDTALVPRGPRVVRLNEDSQASITAQVDRRPRPRVTILPTAWRKRKQGQPLTDEITLSNISDTTDVGGKP